MTHSPRARPRIDILPFKPVYLDLIVDRAEQRGEAESMRVARGLSAARGPAFTAAEIGEDGKLARILCCAGLAENAPDYATAWAHFAEDLRPVHWSAITAAIRAVLDSCAYARVDMIVRAGFDAAHRYAEALGFSLDAMIYARAGTAERNGE